MHTETYWIGLFCFYGSTFQSTDVHFRLMNTHILLFSQKCQSDKKCYFSISISQAFSNQGLEWHSVDVNFIAYGDFQLQFVSTQGHGEIPKALDDIFMSTGSCIDTPGEVMLLFKVDSFFIKFEINPVETSNHTFRQRHAGSLL